ncbi:MAG TPA: hypothetical protein PKI15_10295, partial [Candidatus Cloacimonadota bacterium]|nr:hypothetical protein [Candidatus Cloacimonadota bacterium]
MKKIIMLALLFVPIIIFADGISFTLENSQVTPGGTYGYLEFDIVAVSDVTHYLRAVQVYLDYPIAAFGPAIKNNGTLLVTIPVLPNSYYITINDNTTSRVSLAANLVGFVPYTLNTTPVTLFHAKITIANPSEPLTVAFEPNLMTGQQFYTDGMTNTQYNVMTTGDPIEETLPVELSSFTANIT